MRKFRLDQQAKYARSHEWVRIEEDEAVVGLSDAAQELMGEMLGVELPDIGADVSAGEPIAAVESLKSVEDISTPVSGTVLAINEELLDTPELINDTPYSSWLFKILPGDELEDELDALLSPERYASYVDEEFG